MSATARQLNTPDAAGDLWRVAESGDVEEIRRLLPGVRDVNARNLHGMTALMRAAYYGHEPVVRALLEHGADPNLKRNDKFTALALAAFFGHVETVKTLMEFGARTEVLTRCGASARTWASARTYDDVARCLETHRPVKEVRRPVETHVPRETHTPVQVVAPPAVKTLKDPPEIWDLVHEVPRTFNPRSAFISRITSMRPSLIVGVFAALLVIVACGVGTFVLRNLPSRDLPRELPASLSTVQTKVSDPAPAQAAVSSAPVDVVNDNHARTTPNKSRSQIRQPRASPVANEEPVAAVQSREAPVVASPQFESPKPTRPPAKSNASTPLSPQLIAPTKSSPPKGKVIQWP